MNKFENFVYTNDEAVSEEKCKEIVDYTHNWRDIFKDHLFRPFQRMNVPSELSYRFEATRSSDSNFLLLEMNPEFSKSINEVLDKSLEEYVTKYPAMALITPNGFHSQCIKYHIVKQGEGYHIWHSEWSTTKPTDQRILVWHIALTSHENEGELEFLYHDNRIPSKVGRLIIWPAFFPWVHRGNAIRTNTEKHYLTGWFSCMDGK